jgi:hypothetical protein
VWFVYFSDKIGKCITLIGKRQKLKTTLERVTAILNELQEREKSFWYITATKSVKERLKIIGKAENIFYPECWECVKKGNYNEMTKGKLVVLDSQTTSYREVEKLVMGTWEWQKVGYGVDAADLTHTNIAVRKVWRIENPMLYKQYDAARKRLCLVRLEHSYPVINDREGEHEVVTRTLGAYTIC